MRARGLVALRTCATPHWAPGSLCQRAFSATARRRDTYGFIGIGAMGYPMASNLRRSLAATDELLVHDVNDAAVRRFGAEHGAGGPGARVEAVGTAREAAERAKTIITVLPQPAHVRALFTTLAAPPLPPHPSGPRLFIDCSTIDPSTSLAAAALLAPTADALVDAPMSGGVVGARAATLAFMLGAPTPLLPRARTVLLRMGARVFHMGPAGSGLAAKLANNYLLAAGNAATAEAMRLGMRLGLDARALAELINASSGRCWSSAVNNPVPGVCEGAPAGRGYEGGFAVGLMRKDLRLAVAAAGEAGVRLELAGVLEGLYEAVERREPGKDFSVVYKWLQDREAEAAEVAADSPDSSEGG